MSRDARYKTYTIRSTPLQLQHSTQWTLAIVIEWERDGQVNARPFSAKQKFRSETEADLPGIAYGQLIIDGQVQGSSVD